LLRTGNEIVARVEVFRASHGHLREKLNEVGIDDPNLKFFYRKANNNPLISLLYLHSRLQPISPCNQFDDFRLDGGATPAT